MNVYIITEGEYDNESVTAIVREEDFLEFKHRKQHKMHVLMEAKLKEGTGDRKVAKVAKVMTPISNYSSAGSKGSFGVRCQVLMGEQELRLVNLDEGVGYEYAPVWERSDILLPKV